MGVFNVWQFLDSWGIINYQAPTPPSGTAEDGGLGIQSAGTVLEIGYLMWIGCHISSHTAFSTTNSCTCIMREPSVGVASD